MKSNEIESQLINHESGIAMPSSLFDSKAQLEQPKNLNVRKIKVDRHNQSFNEENFLKSDLK